MAESYPKWVESTVGKGEIARHEQFLLFPQCFQKACFPGALKGVIVWEWVKKKRRRKTSVVELFLMISQHFRNPLTFVL